MWARLSYRWGRALSHRWSYYAFNLVILFFAALSVLGAGGIKPELVQENVWHWENLPFTISVAFSSLFVGILGNNVKETHQKICSHRKQEFTSMLQNGHLAGAVGETAYSILRECSKLPRGDVDYLDFSSHPWWLDEVGRELPNKFHAVLEAFANSGELDKVACLLPDNLGRYVDQGPQRAAAPQVWIEILEKASDQCGKQFPYAPRSQQATAIGERLSEKFKLAFWEVIKQDHQDKAKAAKSLDLVLASDIRSKLDEISNKVDQVYAAQRAFRSEMTEYLESLKPSESEVEEVKGQLEEAMRQAELERLEADKARQAVVEEKSARQQEKLRFAMAALSSLPEPTEPPEGADLLQFAIYHLRLQVFRDYEAENWRHMESRARIITILDPADAWAWVALGAAHTRQEQWDIAISDYDKAIEINPLYAGAFNNRGICYAKQEQYDLAISDYDKAIEINPLYAKAFNNRGNCYSDQKQFDLAISDYNQAIQINPLYAEAFYNRGICYAKQGQFELAISDYDKAIEINPRFAGAYFNRACVLAKMNHLSEMERDLAEAIRLDPVYCSKAQTDPDFADGRDTDEFRRAIQSCP